MRTGVLVKMVSFIDLHCHVDVYSDVHKKVQNAENKGVSIIMNNGINSETNRKTLELSKKFPEIKAAFGFYPIEALKIEDDEIENEINFIRVNSPAAIGEVGLDFKHDKDNHDRQSAIFKKFIEIAKELNVPVIVHSRNAELECIELLEKAKATKVIMHYFSGKMKLVERIVKNGWSLTIPSSVVYSEHFQNIVKKISLSHLFCETDSPYSHPFREENNEPAMVVEAYKKIAELKGMELEEVKNNIFMNYQRMF